MKKTTLMAAIASASLLMSSCGLGTTNNANNGNSTANLLGTALVGALTGNNNVAANNTGNSLLSGGLSILTSLLGNGKITSAAIVGTWTYAQPQVSFESNNALGQIGGELMANSLEKQLSTQLEKIGLKAGVSKFTFDNNGNVAITIGGKTTNGTYQLNGNQLTMTGALGVAKLTSTVTINANQLYMLFDASTLFTSLTKLGSNVSTLSSLLKNFNGMKLGWSMTK